MKYRAIITIYIPFLSSTEAFSPSCPPFSYYPTFPSPFDSIAVFGDSFSDIGNIHILSNGTQPGVWSYNGRYSDGRVWVEYIQQFFSLTPLLPSLGGGINYAYGGATISNEYIEAYSTALNAAVPSVLDQVTQYLEDTGGSSSSSIAEKRLHIVFAGYNDYWCYVYRNYTTAEGQDFNLTNVYTTVATNLVRQVQRLYNDGARVFLIGNVPNMSSWAEASLQPQDVLDTYDVLVNGHNSLLASLLSKFEEECSDATVYDLDAFDCYNSISTCRAFYGIENVDDACHPNESEGCGDIFSYKFWDYYHPTAHAHQIASMFALESIYNKSLEKRRSKSAKNPPVKTSLRKA